jgi:hypothetical protein
MSAVIGSGNIGYLEDIAYVTLVTFSIGLILAFVGITIYLRRMRPKNNTRRITFFMNRLSLIISGKRSAKIFALVAIVYGLFFGVVSSTLVFQPGLTFSDTYGVSVPSAVPVLCCGAFGQMPQLVIYLTQQFAILIIPANVILLFTVSWLVGLNASIANYTYTKRPQFAGGKWISGFGAFVGMFTICPTCAGFFFLATVGLSGAVALALTLSSLQTLFIAVGIPFLLITPIITTRRISDLNSCGVSNDNSISS